MRRAWIVLAVLFTSSATSRGDIITRWTFETSIPATAGPHTAEEGANTVGSQAIAIGLNAISSPTGNGSLHSFSGNGWNVGDYFQFQTSTVGFDLQTITWDQAAQADSGAGALGPTEFTISYSTNGTTFTTLAAPLQDYSAVGLFTPWSSTTPNATYNQFVDVGFLTALDNAPTVYFRLTNRSTVAPNGGSVTPSGLAYLDNFTFNGIAAAEAVPEPGPMLLTGSALGVLVLWRVRRRTRSSDD